MTMTLEDYCRLPAYERDRICDVIAKRGGYRFAEVQGWMNPMVERYMIYESCWNDEYTAKAREYLDVYNNLTNG